MRTQPGGGTHFRLTVSCHEWPSYQTQSKRWKETRFTYPKEACSQTSSYSLSWCTNWRKSTTWSTISTCKCSNPYRTCSTSTHLAINSIRNYTMPTKAPCYNTSYTKSHQSRTNPFHIATFTWKLPRRNVLKEFARETGSRRKICSSTISSSLITCMMTGSLRDRKAISIILS